MEHGIVQARAATPGQIKDLAMTLIGAMPTRMTFEEAFALLKVKGRVTDGVRELFIKLTPSSTFDFFGEVVIGGSSQMQIVDELKKSHTLRKNVPKVWAIAMAEHKKFTTVSEMTKLTLVARTLRELRFERSAYLRDIYVRALEEGLQLCPPEVGVRLWLEQDKYPFKAPNYYRIAMEPIPAEPNRPDDSLPGIFEFEMGEEYQCLCADQGLARDFDLDSKFIFVKP